MKPFIPIFIAFQLSLLPAPTLSATDAALPYATPQNSQAGQQRPSSTAQAKRDPKLQAIIDMAAGAPPEFGTDVMIRLAESKSITERAFKTDLLKRAFYSAESAQQPVPRVSMPGSLVDTRSGYMSAAYGMKMDRLSLKLRAVNALLPLEAKTARELFEQMQFPDLQRLGCEEPLAYDLTLFYQTLANVVRDGFTAQEKLEEHHSAFLMPYVRVQYHAQVRPVARLLLDIHLSPAQLGGLANVFAASLQRVREDGRSFTHATTSLALEAIAGLIRKLEAKEIPSIALVQASREYMLTNFRDSVCLDIVRTPAPKKSVTESIQYFIQRFNEGLGPTAAMRNAKIALISAEELQDAHAGPEAKVYAYWQSSPAKDLLMGIKKLRFGDRSERLSTEERMTFAWNAQLADFLKDLESWKPDSDDAGDFFHQKSVLYEGLIELTPAGPERSRIIDSFVKFMGQNYFQRESRIDWFWHVNHLLAQPPGKDKEEVVEAFLNSRDLILNLYANLERWAPRNTDRPNR
jgi:hypothetical protein